MINTHNTVTESTSLFGTTLSCPYLFFINSLCYTPNFSVVLLAGRRHLESYNADNSSAHFYLVQGEMQIYMHDKHGLWVITIETCHFAL